MKKLFVPLFIATFIISVSSCEKDEDIIPETPTTTTPIDTTGNGGGSGGGGSSNVTEANVNGLEQNHIKADGRSEDYLYITNIGGYTSNNEDYFTLHMTGQNRHTIDFTIKGSDLREGNFSLKKFRLGSSPGPNEAVMYAGISGNLMDFESTDANAVSIIKNAEGFYVVKMAPIVGINRNSWDDVITEPISVHVVTNHNKITTSNAAGDTFDNDIYSHQTSYNSRSNQPSNTTSVNPISITFRDYDFSNVTSLAKATYTLNTTAASSISIQGGTAHKAINMSYLVNWLGWKQNMTKNQTIEMELTATTMIVSFDNIEFVNPSDATDTRVASGKWEMAR